MNETDWLTCAQPTPMMRHLANETSELIWRLVAGKVSERKLILIACACQRRLFPVSTSDRFWRNCTTVLERYAEGLLDRQQLPAYLADSEPIDTGTLLFKEAARSAAQLGLIDGPKEERAQADLVRCIIGNPFRSDVFDPSWRTEDVIGVALGVHNDRAFDRLPILSDALMDAGCEDETILAHCRSLGPHARGCWVVDRVLGKN